jgi:hypothetical protein
MRKKQGYNARLDELLGERNRKKSPASKTKRTTKRAATLSPDINQHKRMAMGENVLTGKMIKRAKGGMAGRRKESEGMEKAKGRRKYAAVGTMDKGKKTKQRGGRTAADSARAAARTHPRGSWATRLPRSLLKKGGRAPATTGVKLNMGAPKVKTITARGMGAALRGGQFRENT